jgi:hypothetical protein
MEMAVRLQQMAERFNIVAALVNRFEPKEVMTHQEAIMRFQDAVDDWIIGHQSFTTMEDIRYLDALIDTFEAQLAKR